MSHVHGLVGRTGAVRAARRESRACTSCGALTTDWGMVDFDAHCAACAPAAVARTYQRAEMRYFIPAPADPKVAAAVERYRSHVFHSDPDAMPVDVRSPVYLDADGAVTLDPTKAHPEHPEAVGHTTNVADAPEEP